jgi:hypothetical protein
MQILPVLGNSVRWAHPAHEHLDEWAGFVQMVVTRYGKRLPVVEVWNEPNLSGFWKDPNPTNYLALLRRTHETVKSVDPSIRVAFGGTSGVPFAFIEEIYKLGGAKWFDIMNIHPYTEPDRSEGDMDVKIERLRELMAKYGDAKKPIWITEIGWPTHRMGISHNGLFQAGLEVARPNINAWRMLYVPARTDEEGDVDETVRLMMLDALPKGSSVEICRPVDLSKRLARGDVDGVVYPFTEDYAVDSFDAVCAFVKSGGVLVDFGGFPMSYAYRMDTDGRLHLDKKAKPMQDRRRLRIDSVAWWMDKRYPEALPVHPTAAVRGVKEPSEGFKGQRFFTGRMLKSGDEFVPLLSASTNGIDTVAAAVYRFNSDMKGALVVSGLYSVRGLRGTCSEDRQARMMARALGIAFAEGIENFFWYEFRQPDRKPFDPESYFGMVHDNFAPKPAYGAYMTFIDVRPAGSIQNSAAWRSEDGTIYFPQWTRPDGRKAGMVWTTRAAHERKMTFTSSGMTFLDVSGARVRPECEGNAYKLVLSGSPIYFIGGEIEKTSNRKDGQQW